jgi:hypothetical protein
MFLDLPADSMTVRGESRLRNGQARGEPSSGEGTVRLSSKR